VPLTNYLIEVEATVGSPFRLRREIGNLPPPRTVTQARLKMKRRPADDNATLLLFEKLITPTLDNAQGQITNQNLYTLTTNGVALAGASSITVLPLPVTVDSGATVYFSGGAYAELVNIDNKPFYEGQAELKLAAPLRKSIANGATALYRTVEVFFQMTSANTRLLSGGRQHEFEIELTYDNGETETQDYGRIVFAKEATGTA